MDSKGKYMRIKFWCWNKECPDYGKRGKGNIVLRNGTGKNGIWLLRCKTSDHCFSENHENHVFPIQKHLEREIYYIIIVSREGEVSAGLSRATEHDKKIRS